MNQVAGGADNAAKRPPRLMLWFVGGIGFAVCSLVLLLWGLNGPTYIFDLIVAFCG